MSRAQFDYIEITHAGQAGRLGRYPIHFHMEGDVHGSYVKGCAIHRSFNRAVTMHGVHSLVVERNVIYDILGECSHNLSPSKVIVVYTLIRGVSTIFKKVPLVI